MRSTASLDEAAHVTGGYVFDEQQLSQLKAQARKIVGHGGDTARISAYARTSLAPWFALGRDPPARLPPLAPQRLGVTWRTARLEDGDVVLRAWKDGDQELLGTSQRDPVVGRYFGRRLDVSEGDPLPDDPDAPVFAILEAGTVVGVIWFARGVRPFEVGYYLHPDAWGRGLATRALARVSEWMLDERGEERIVLHTHPEQRPARKRSRTEPATSRTAPSIRTRHFKDGTTRALQLRARAATACRPHVTLNTGKKGRS